MSAQDAATLDAVPHLAKLFRLQWEDAQQSWVLLYPEGMVKLNASAGEIMRRCDGVRTVGEIVAELEDAFSTGGLAEDVLAFVDMARVRGWLQ